MDNAILVDFSGQSYSKIRIEEWNFIVMRVEIENLSFTMRSLCLLHPLTIRCLIRIRPRIHIIADAQALYTQYLQRIAQQKTGLSCGYARSISASRLERLWNPLTCH